MPLCHLCSLLREMVRCCRGFAECSDVALMLHQAEGVTGSSCFRSVLAAGHFSVSSSFFRCHKRGQWLRYQSAATSPNTPMVPPGPAQPQGSHDAKKLQSSLFRLRGGWFYCPVTQFCHPLGSFPRGMASCCLRSPEAPGSRHPDTVPAQSR